MGREQTLTRDQLAMLRAVDAGRLVTVRTPDPTASWPDATYQAIPGASRRRQRALVDVGLAGWVEIYRNDGGRCDWRLRESGRVALEAALAASGGESA